MGVIEYVEQTRRVNKDIMLAGFTARQAVPARSALTLTPRAFFGYSLLSNLVRAASNASVASIAIFACIASNASIWPYRTT